VRTVERRSITAAARDLGLSQPAVSKLLRRLEEHAGARLLDRSSRAVRPTPQGLALYEASQSSLATIDAAVEAVRKDMGEVSGTLRVHGPVCLGESHVHRIIADFQDRHPSVAVGLTLENRDADLINQNIDVAIKIGRPVANGHILRRIGLIERILVAAPTYLAQHAPLRRYTALTGHNVIVTDAVLSRRGTLTLCKGGVSREVRINPLLRTNNAQVLIEALKAGRGVGPVQLPLVTRELQSGELVRVLPEYHVKPSELFITYATSRFLRPVVRSFVDFLAPALKRVEGIS
jgi:DNA-binding transcriptional LysR family regulator